MRIILFSGGFVFIPLVVAVIYRLGRWKYNVITYFITFLLTLSYPAFYYQVHTCFYDPLHWVGECPVHDIWTGYTAGYFIPGALIVQAVFNRVFGNTFYERIKPLT